MKLVLAIVNHDDANTVIKQLTKAGYPVTKLATTGGFLMVGNVTLILGLEDEQVEGALSVIAQYSHSRQQLAPTTSELGLGFYSAMPMQVTVGGAAVFVMPIERYDKY